MKKEHRYYVYILASKKKGTLYIGMTNNVLNRNFQHKTKLDKNSFTAKYNVERLVYYEIYKYVNDAIQRGKDLKRYKKKWKIELIEKDKVNSEGRESAPQEYFLRAPWGTTQRGKIYLTI